MTSAHLLRKMTALLVLATLTGLLPGYAGSANRRAAGEPVSDSTTISPHTDTRIEESQGGETRPVAPQPLEVEELDELAARAEQPGEEVAGGALNNQQLTYIVIALAAAVLVLVLK